MSDAEDEDLTAIVEAGEDAVDRSVHPSGIVPVLQCVREASAARARRSRARAAEGRRRRLERRRKGIARGIQFAAQTRRRDAPDERRTSANAGERLTARRAKRRNIVATVNLDCKLDLKTIAFHARNVEYNPKVRQP